MRALVGIAAVVVCGSIAAAMASGCGTASCEQDQTCAPGASGDATDEQATVDGRSDREGGVGEAETGGGKDAANDAPGDSPVVDGDAGDGFSCDPTGEPRDAPCVVNEQNGVFVSAGGDDANAGTRAKPVKTIGHAMDLGKGAQKRVYACAGTYAEKLVVGSSRDGVSLYGGLDCATWSYAPSNRVVVAPVQTGYALELDGLQMGATFEDIEFDAQDANTANAGESSIAVFANASKNVALVRVAMVAGKASPGAAGASGGPNPDGGASGDPSNWSTQSLNGNTATDAGGAQSNTCACPDGASSTGGQGGGAGASGQAPAAGLPSYGGDAGAGSPGANATSCGTGGTARDGTNAPMGLADTASTSLGTLTASGWTPANGTPGSNGKPGQGGGGGGNGSLLLGGGGGGGCGGCGGVGGKPAGAGGSSVALLSYQSNVALVGCTLTTGAAGSGGAGGKGEAGQAGGNGGVQFVPGCPGGGGGAGAGGNGAQGGPGGLSLGIGYVGTAPNIDGSAITQATTISGITAGAAGVGGAKGIAGPAAASSAGQPGADGAQGQNAVAQAVLGL